ncbi:MAG: right-handed parallel beta-helix repeat-containing protein, partial [bacterium]|nr:right-handed parallel beta-helix repeat-containing protein [bacterium]
HQAAFKRWPLAAVKGDFDDDTRVNLDDYPDFADCLAGPGTAPSPTLPTTTQRCLDVFDFDEDGDVDLMDHRGFQSAFDVPGIIYVDADAGGDNDGSSWQSAYTDLHGALAAALPIDRIWVAAGVYTPAGPGGDRTAGFQLPPDVPIYGGFAGFETGLDQRDYVANPTVLSGDLNGDDTPGFGNVSDNSYHVVRMDSTSDASVLDGFTITGGNADGTNPNNRGAGILNDGGDGNLINCTVLGNRAKNGAGMVNLGASPTLINVGFSGNDAFNAAGGGMNNDSSTPVLINCTFSLNHSGSDGGGIYNKNAATLTLVNSILWGNSDAGGTDESAQLTNAAGTSTAVDYSCLQGWTGALGGTGNTGSDPALADPGGLDDIAGTLDDDFRLTGGSPVIDQGNTGAVPDDFADIDGDSNTVEQLPWDLDGNPRITGTPAEVDMGAYEY